MVQHVWERCRLAEGVAEVIVATEDRRILDACAGFGARAEMTKSEHLSGTDRVAEVCERHPEYQVVVNVQGDEPGIEPQTVAATIQVLINSNWPIGTAATPIRDNRELLDPNVVKVVLSDSRRALYFSRAAVPYRRNASVMLDHLRHLGIYAFRREMLLKVSKLVPSRLEQVESLEQLRWLEAGIAIGCAVVESRSIGVDTPEDVDLLLSRTSLTLPT